MRIRTNYNVVFHANDGEVFSDESLTDQSQYISIGDIVRRTLRGEILDVVDWSKRNPLERSELFDVMDAAASISRKEPGPVQPDPVDPVQPDPVDPVQPDPVDPGK